MAKKNNDYFRLLAQQTSYCVAAAMLLEEILGEYSIGQIAEYRKQMHEIEHSADQMQHDIMSMLSVEFITPIDQEDILHLVQLFDDITDALDEVVLNLYMYHIEALPTGAGRLAAIVSRCVNTLHEAAKELRGYKRPEALNELLVKINEIESEADMVYLEVMRELFGSAADARVLLQSKAIYEGLEHCCDLCEHAGEVISQVIIKNT